MIPLESGFYYHIYNRGNNGENIFIEKRNYIYFLQLYLKYVDPLVTTYAYCLLVNHFHLLIRINENKDWQSLKDCQSSRSSKTSPSRAFATLFSTYTKAINNSYQRSGSLFEKSFHRKIITNKGYLTTLVKYIHLNPKMHGLVDEFHTWPFSSYHAILSERLTKVNKEGTIGWFGDRDLFLDFHLDTTDFDEICDIVDNDF